MQVFIVRHGECYGNVDSTRYQSADTALTPLGVRQAACVGRRLAELGITHIVSSPLQRALATAQTIAEQNHITTIEVWMELREGNHGEYWCERRSVLAAVAPHAVLPEELGEEGWLHATLNNQEFTERCERAVMRIKETFSHDDRVAIVTHGLTGSNLLHVLLGIPWQRPSWFTLTNGSISEVRIVPDPVAERSNRELLPPVDVEVEYINDLRHLSAL